MNKRLLGALLCWLSLLSFGARAQTTLATETFEGLASDFGYSSNSFSLNSIEYFERRAFTANANGVGYTGTTQGLNNREGSYTWTGEGVRGTGTTNDRSPGYVVLNPLTNSASYKNFVITVAFAAPRGGTFSGAGANMARSNDRIRIQYSFNGGSWTTAALLMGNNRTNIDASDFEQISPLSDSTAIGNGITPTNQGIILDQTYRDITATLPSTAIGANLRVRVVADFKLVEAAFDNIRVTGVLDNTAKPTLNNLEMAAASYTEGTSPVPLTSNLTVAYSDGSATTLTGGSVSVSGAVSGQDVLNYTNQNGITGTTSLSGGVLTLTLTGTATQAAYQAALRSITYSNANTTTLASSTRTLSFQLNNGATTSGTATRPLTITAALNAAAMLNYTENFDTDGEGTRYFGNTFFSISEQTGFFRSTTNPPTYNGNHISDVTYSGFSGGFWFGEGTDGANNPTSPASTLQLAPVNASNRSDIKFTIALGAGGNWIGYNNAANPGDGFELYYRLNGGSLVKFASFYGNGGTARFDADGIITTPATGTALTTALQDFTFTLPASAAVSNLDFFLRLQTRGATEIAFDNIRITASVPPTVTTTGATNITTTSATLGGNVTADGGGTLTERGVVYVAGTGTPTTSDTKALVSTSGVTTGSFSGTVSGLAAGTTYTVRAYAINGAGPGYGNPITFTTNTTVTSIVRAGTNPTNAATVNYTVTFANPVTGLSASNFSIVTTGLTGVISIGTITGSGTTYTVPVNTGSGSGTLTLNLANSMNLTPAVANVPFTGETYTIDKTAPTVTLSSSTVANGGSTTTSPVSFTAQFSESVGSTFLASDVTVSGGTVANFVTGSAANSYTFDVVPSAGAVSVSIAAGMAQDAAGNNNTAATPNPYTFTYSLPSATVTSIARQTPAAAATATATVSYLVTFSAPVSGVTVSNFSLTTTGVSGASVTGVSPGTGSSATYSVTVNTGTGNGTVQLNVANSTGITPTISNTPYNGTSAGYTIVKNFNAGPQLSLRAAGSASGANSDVTAFVDGVQVVQNGTSTTVANALQNGSFETNNLGASDYLYPSTGLVAAPWAFTSQAGVARIGGSGFAPAASGQGSFVGFLQSNGAGNGTVAQSLAVPTGTYQVNFVAAQRGNQGTSDQVVNVFLNNGTTDVFVGSIQPASATAYSTFTSAAFSVTAPALTATVSTASASPTSSTAIPFSVSFSQSVGTTFMASDVTVANGTVTSGSFNGSGSGPYTFTVTPTGSNSTVTVSLAAGVANDANNTQNQTSNSVSVQYQQAVTAAPVLTQPANASTTNSLPTFSGTAPMGSTVTIYLAIGSNTAQVIGTTTAPSGSFSFTPATALASGSYAAYATAQSSGAAVSANSNTNTFTVDATAPTVLSINRQNPAAATTNATSLTFLVTFSESVTGVDATDFTLTTTAGTVSSSGRTVSAVSGSAYTVTVSGVSGNGTVRLDLNASGTGIADAVGNPIGGGYTGGQTYTLDQTAPTVTLSTTSGSPTSTAPIPFSATFSETVTNFSASGISVSNGTVTGNTVSGSGSGSYTFTVTPTGSGTVTVSVVANAAQDAAGNSNFASNSVSVSYTAPVTATTWTAGAGTQDWFTAGNWSAGVPTAGTDALIPAGVRFYPLVTAAGAVTRALTINSSGSVTLAILGTLTVNGLLTNGGTITQSAGTLTVNGNMSLSGAITKSAGTVSVTGSLTSTGTLTQSGGDFAVGGSLTNNTSGTVSQTGGTLNVSGDLTNNGTFTTTNPAGTGGGTVLLGSASAGASANILGSQAIRFWNLTVNAGGAQLSTSAGASVRNVLALNGNFTTNGNVFTLESASTGTALVVNNGTSVVTGTTTVQRYIDPSLNSGPGYRHYSAPVSNSTVGDLATPTGFTPVVNPAYNAAASPSSVQPFPTVFGYNEQRVNLSNSLTPFDRGYVSPTALSDQLTVGRGYTVNIGANQLVDFQGTLNTGTLTVPLTSTRDTNPDGGWQLLGNPYPAPLNYNLVNMSDREGLDGAIYVFHSTSQYGGQYSSFNNGFGSSILPVGQGFFARVSAQRTSATLTFRNSQRLTTPDATAFQRQAETRPVVQLTLQGTSSPLTDELYVYFEPGATDSFDRAFDAEKLPNPSGLNLSSSLSVSQRLSIDGRGPLGTAQQVVPLAVGVPAAGTYALAVAQLLNLSQVPVYLRDKQTGALIDLAQQPSYQFAVSTAATLLTGRFELVFSPQQPLATVPAALAQQVLVYPNPAKGQVAIELPASLSGQPVTATLVDAVGRPVREQVLPAGRASHTLLLTDLATGVYALRLRTELGTVVRKLVVE